MKILRKQLVEYFIRPKLLLTTQNVLIIQSGKRHTIGNPGFNTQQPCQDLLYTVLLSSFSSIVCSKEITKVIVCYITQAQTTNLYCKLQPTDLNNANDMKTLKFMKNYTSTLYIYHNVLINFTITILGYYLLCITCQLILINN